MLNGTQRLQFERRVTSLHTKPARVMAGFLEDLATRIGGLPAILALLEEYERLPLPAIKVAGADRFPPRPLRRVA